MRKVNYVENIELEMEMEDVENCYHMGSCDNGCTETIELPYIREQLDKYTDDELREAVRSYGIDDVDEFDRKRLEMYVVWLIAGNIIDEQYED